MLSLKSFISFNLAQVGVSLKGFPGVLIYILHNIHAKFIHFKYFRGVSGAYVRLHTRINISVNQAKNYWIEASFSHWTLNRVQNSININGIHLILFWNKILKWVYSNYLLAIQYWYREQRKMLQNLHFSLNFIFSICLQGLWHCSRKRSYDLIKFFDKETWNVTNAIFG